MIDIKDLRIFPYYRNVPGKNGIMEIECSLLSYNEYVNNLHYNPIKHLKVLQESR